MLNISNIVFEVLSAVLYLLVMVALPVLLGFIQIHAQKRSSVCIDAKCVGNEMIASKGVMNRSSLMILITSNIFAELLR